MYIMIYCYNIHMMVGGVAQSGGRTATARLRLAPNVCLVGGAWKLYIYIYIYIYIYTHIHTYTYVYIHT